MRIPAQNWRIANGLWRIVFIFLLLAFSFSLLAGSASAQTTSTTVGSQKYTNQYSSNLNPDVPRDQHSFIQSLVIEVMGAGVCQLAGVDLIKRDQECLGIDPKTGKIGFVENGGGAIGVIGHFIAYTFTPPISSGDYVRYLSGNFGITKKAYAQTCSDPDNTPQGVGFCGIQPLLGIWVEMRNIAYLLFVMIFVIIGVAIMLRVHIDPRTVMTIENQIPRIIVGILLVTFSFAIAGFLIDVMYVSIYLVGGVLFGLIQQPPAVPAPGINFNDVATSPTPFDIINRLFEGGWGGLSTQGKDTIQTLILNVFDAGFETEPGIIELATGGPAAWTGLIVGILAYIIIFIALIYTAIRLWIILVVAYISILIDIVFAPFWFLIGLFPGSTLGVGAWFKDMLANLAVFPTAISMFILAKVFYQIAQGAFGSGKLFVPPLAGGGQDANVFAGLIALGFLFMTPHVLQITRSAIKAPAINYGPVFQDPGAALRAGVGTAREIGATRIASQEYVPGAGGSWAQRGLRRAFGSRTFR